jgi:hypothetical protein
MDDENSTRNEFEKDIFSYAVLKIGNNSIQR